MAVERKGLGLAFRFSPDMADFIAGESKRLGMTKTAYVQMLIAQEMANDDRQRAMTAEVLLKEHGILNS